MSGKDMHVHECVDREFVFELAKRGHVKVLSRQVCVRGCSLDLSGINLPPGCEIEGAYTIRTHDDQRPEVSITFGWK